MRTHSISPERFMPGHFLISESDGHLYDVRIDGWHAMPPLRANFRGHKRQIESVADLKAALRAGRHVWPGGHAVYFFTEDGSVLSFDAVLDNLGECIEAVRSGNNCGWHVVSMATTEGDEEPQVCDHTGRVIV